MVGAPERQLSAIVVGAGAAGLLASHVACRYFENVVIVESDSLQRESASSLLDSAEGLKEGSKKHRGIPQYTQPHLVLAGGLQSLDSLLPGFTDELVRRGGVPVDFSRDSRVFNYGVVVARGESSVKVVGASRHLIQSTLEDEVFSRNPGKLHLRDGCKVSGLMWNADKSSVTGVELEGGEKLAADLVIVASGRTPRLPQWLAAAGHAQPPQKKVDARLVYVSRTYKIPAGWDGGWSFHACYDHSDPAGRVRGANVLPIEGGMWQMYAVGTNGIVPPTDEEGYLEYLRTLPDQEIYNAIKQAEPVTPPSKYGGAFNYQRGWHEIQLPGGILAVGDAAQALSPVYGHGCAVAAKSVIALGEAMGGALATSTGEHEARRAALHGVGPAFHRQLITVLAQAWELSTSEDLRQSDTKVEGDVQAPPKLVTAYVDTLVQACSRDPKASAIFWGLTHLQRPSHHVFHPRLLAAVVTECMRQVAQSALAVLSMLPALVGGGKLAATKLASK